eukprot:5485122-Pleurochrysis_carterae.AAC.1
MFSPAARGGTRDSWLWSVTSSEVNGVRASEHSTFTAVGSVATRREITEWTRYMHIQFFIAFDLIYACTCRTVGVVSVCTLVFLKIQETRKPMISRLNMWLFCRISSSELLDLKL